MKSFVPYLITYRQHTQVCLSILSYDYYTFSFQIYQILGFIIYKSRFSHYNKLLMIKLTRGEFMDLIIGNKIKVLRKNLGLTQKELAAQIGIAQQTLGGYEKNKSQPDIETLKRLATFFQFQQTFFWD